MLRKNWWEGTYSPRPPAFETPWSKKVTDACAAAVDDPSCGCESSVGELPTSVPGLSVVSNMLGEGLTVLGGQAWWRGGEEPVGDMLHDLARPKCDASVACERPKSTWSPVSWRNVRR